MKILGAILLLCATTWIGFDVSSTLSNRPRQIRQLKNALQVMEAEIVYGQSPVSEVCFHLSSQLPEPLRAFFQRVYQRLTEHHGSLYEVWQEELDHFWPQTAMKQTEKEIMDQFGKTLGQHDFTQQQKHIYLAISHLDRELKNAEDEMNRYSKMAKSLGVLIGMFFVLLLI
ncbi:stage III sporulation protein AB [Melghiribacillus thermohalophilus]|uniref:Stage III sporulation protein AB n=1 Tax=Melghiribacillus thermohalophilus TaxID=1324956 RepID=A0A4R3N6Y7_9BACI|nr:stage III sporulation protein SpoIIIAB [Melghiribacillus thermohalophilus]TCT22629.1 stage III sporulation protein AB [Melghiribacillus thermohalophilus]